MDKFAKINGFKLSDEAWKKATTQESSKSDVILKEYKQSQEIFTMLFDFRLLKVILLKKF